MDDRSNTALIALRRILRVTELNARELAAHSDFTTSQLLVLQHVAREGKTLPSAIARAVKLKQATVTVLLKKLESGGFVTRRRDTEDRRRIWIELTGGGTAALQRSPDLLQNRFERSFARLDDWEQAMIVAALERVALILDATEIDASPVLDVGNLDRLIESLPEPKGG